MLAELEAFRAGPLQGQPSHRELARVAGVAPTTIGNWLRKKQFPQVIDPLLALVRAVQARADRVGQAGEPAAAFLHPQTWRRAYEAEARRRAEVTSTAVLAGHGRTALEGILPGLPLSEVVDPFYLEVHRSIASPVTGLPMLPAYVPREHDRVLAEVVAQAAGGASQIAVLVGGSSTGKTRACWEALAPLRESNEPWRLWHPIAPTRPDAVLADLADLAPHTVVWLNEAQFYLTADRLGEQVAAELRTLLRDRRRGPVLVLATLWPNYWDALTARAGRELHPQARELLDGHRIGVPDAFTAADLTALHGTVDRDPRLGEAAAHATDGQITQYLAGVQVLLNRYQNAAPPATKALIHAAMDARRLGAGPRIPLAWLTQAAPGYLTETEWDHTGEDWLEQALDYATKPCNGVPGILTPVKAGSSRNQRTPRANRTEDASAVQGPLYRLADYLEQKGRRERAEQIPPIDFWTAAAAHAHRADLAVLGDAARARGLYRDAAQLHKHATVHGASFAPTDLVRSLHDLHPADQRPAEWAAAHVAVDRPYATAGVLIVLWRFGVRELVTDLAKRASAHAALDNPGAVATLLETLRVVGAHDQVAMLLARDPASQVALDALGDVCELLDILVKVAAKEQITVLIDRIATTAALDDPLAPFTMPEVLVRLQELEAEEQIRVLIDRIATTAALDEPYTVAWLLDALLDFGTQEQVATLLARKPAAHASLNSPGAVAVLMNSLRKARAHEQVADLATWAAAHITLVGPLTVGRLLGVLQEAGAREQVATLLARKPAAHVALDDPQSVSILLAGLRSAGAQEEIAVLMARTPAAHVALDDPGALTILLHRLKGMGAQDQATLLADRAATHVTLGDLHNVAVLLNWLHDAGAHAQVTTLAKRAAADAALDNPHTVRELLEALGKVKAHEQVTTLAKRAAADAALDNRHTVPRLLEVVLPALKAARAGEHIAVLTERLPGSGCFDSFIRFGDHGTRFRSGREPDGRPADPWSWQELE
ncbi:hypothetical protein [Streptomyces lavendofoliae]|nr:hypothetical protein [Streptomyces lavendofoliae]